MLLIYSYDHVVAQPFASQSNMGSLSPESFNYVQGSSQVFGTI